LAGPAGSSRSRIVNRQLPAPAGRRSCTWHSVPRPRKPAQRLIGQRLLRVGAAPAGRRGRRSGQCANPAPDPVSEPPHEQAIHHPRLTS
jgi:hypothetical protein